MIMEGVNFVIIIIKIYIGPRKATEAPPCQILLKDSLKRYVLRRNLKVANDVEFLMSGGREFQTTGDACLMPHSDILLVVLFFMKSVTADD